MGLVEKSWTDVEHWTWEQICAGEPADFDAKYGQSDAKLARAFGNSRSISGSFLRNILLTAELERKIPTHGVQIKGARIYGDIDLDYGRMSSRLRFQNSRFDDKISLIEFKSESIVSFESCYFAARGADAFNAGGLAAHHMFLRRSIFRCAAAVTGATLKGQLDISGSEFPKGIDASEVCAESFVANGTICNTLNIANAKISGHLDLFHSIVGDKLRLTFASAGNLQLIDSDIGEFDGLGFECSGQARISGTRFAGYVSLQEAKVGDLTLAPSMRRGTRFSREVDMNWIQIAGVLNLAAASFKGMLNLAEAAIGRDVICGITGSRRTKFQVLDISNANIGGSLRIYQSQFAKEVTMRGLQVAGDLICGGSAHEPMIFQAELNLDSSKIDGSLRCWGARFKGEVSIRDATIGSNLLLSGTSESANIFDQSLDLGICRVGQQANLQGIEVAGSLRLEDVSVGQHLLIAGVVSKDTKIDSALVGGSIILDGLEVAGQVIPTCDDHDARAHWRRPMVMMRHG